MANVTGHQKLVKQFQAVADEAMVRELGRALYAAGGAVENAAKGSIMAGSSAGTKTKKHKHVASRPGEPPNNFTQRLHDNIETSQISPLVVEVSSNMEYSAPLEFGTSRMAARPFMGPAARESKPEVLNLVNQAIKAQLRKVMKK